MQRPHYTYFPACPNQFAPTRTTLYPDVLKLLNSLKLDALYYVFEAEDVDMESLRLMRVEHYVALGVKMGPIVKIQHALTNAVSTQ